MRSVAYYITALIFTIIYFVLLSLVFLLTVAFDRERVVLHYASMVWARTIFWLNPWWKVKVEGLENIDRSKAYVIVNNHQSMLDIPLMYALPLTFKWVSKREVYKMPIFGLVLRMHGDIAIERGGVASTRKMVEQGCERLARGTSVIIFPEGTRTKDGRVGRFKDGAFVMARQAEVAVLPCAIEGTGSVMNGWKVRMPYRFTVRVLPEIPVEQVEALSSPELAQLAHEMILEAHKELRSDLYEK